MSGTRSPSRTAPATRIWILWLILWPFATSAVAINVFMAGLLAQTVGLSALSPTGALALSLPLGLPATWAAARWVRGLLEQAGRD